MTDPIWTVHSPRLDATLRPPPDPLADELLPLLEPPLDRAFDDQTPAALGHSLLRQRLMARVARSAHASRAFVTVRPRDEAIEVLAPGVTAQWLYARPGPAPGRAGEPDRVRLLNLLPGSRWQPEDGTGGGCTEWLVMRGTLVLGQHALAPLHYLRLGPQQLASLYTEAGALLYLREGPAKNEPQGSTQSAPQPVDGVHGWLDFAPGIRRRLLWHNAAGEAAMLYLAQPGAAVPRHGHRHDEECLMIDGELFLDDVLLRRGDYQLAPVGSVHGSVTTDTGALLFAHGDIDLDVRPD